MTLPADPSDPPDPPNPLPAARGLGLFSFAIEGRRAPGLFAAGWVLTVAGAGLLAMWLLGGSSTPVFAGFGVAAATIGLVLLAGSQAIERRAAGAPYAGPSPVLLFLVVVGASWLLAFAVGIPLALVGAKVSRPVGELILALLQAAVFVGTVRLLVIGTRALSAAELGLVGDRRSIGRDLVAGSLYLGPVILATAVVSVIVVNVVGAVPESPLPPTGSAAGAVLHLLVGVVIAPPAEELLFRGAMLTAWLRTVGPRAAIARSSLLFVVAHVLTIQAATFEEAARLAVVAALVRLPVSVALGWLFVRTGRLWPSIGLHATFNGFLIVISELAVNG